MIEYEADTKHADIIIAEMGLEKGSKGVEAPIEKEVVEEGARQGDEEKEEDLMDQAEAKKFRAVAARANYLSLDRPDIQYTAKEICKHMARPRKRHWAKPKRLARYLLMYPRLVWRFMNEANVGEEYLEVFSDSDWAGDRVTRRSTSGGMAVLAGGLLKSWSSTQGTVAMSSGEAEYYAMVKAAAEALAIQALAKDLGYSMKIRLWVDSTAAKAIVSRIGLGKIRHMEVKYVWAQEAHKIGRFEVRKVHGTRNPSDINTKPKTASEMADLLEKAGSWLDELARVRC